MTHSQVQTDFKHIYTSHASDYPLSLFDLPLELRLQSSLSVNQTRRKTKFKQIKINHKTKRVKFNSNNSLFQKGKKNKIAHKCCLVEYVANLENKTCGV